MADTMPDLYAECATCDPEVRVSHLVDLRWTPMGTLTCRHCWDGETESEPTFEDLAKVFAGPLVRPVRPAPADPISQQPEVRDWEALARMVEIQGVTGALAADRMIGRVVTLRSHPMDAMTVTRTERAADIGEVEVAFMFDGRPAFAVLPIAALTDYSTDNL